MVLHDSDADEAGTISGAANASTKLCSSFPRRTEGAVIGWDGFTDLHAVQFILPAALAKRTAALHLSSPAGADFQAYYREELLPSRNGAVLAAYPPKASAPGAPAHLTLIPRGGDGSKVQAVWVSYRADVASYECASYDHCCILNDDGDVTQRDVSTGSCDLRPPSWQCYDERGARWTSGRPIGSIAFLGTLASSKMADGGSVLLHLSDGADLSVPLSNTYATHPIVDSPACARLCAKIGTRPTRTIWGDADADSCMLSGAPAIRAASGFGAITVNGFGRLNGWRMMQGFRFQGGAVSAAPAAGKLNGYGSVVDGFRSMGDAEAHTRWRVMSGLLELTTASDKRPFAIDVSELTVAWGPKRGDGTIRLNFLRVPLDGGLPPDASNRPVRLYDVKTPGTWVDAADGPRVTADGSYLGHLYLQAADDNVKVDSSHSTLEHLTLLQGNVGSAVELGTYGIGIRDEAVRAARVYGVYLHRITQPSGMDDGLGSLLGSRTCPWGITLEDISIGRVHVPAAPGNRITSLIKIGTLGAPDNRFANRTNLDRWFFCNNRWWRQAGGDNQTVQRGAARSAARFVNLTMARWKVEVMPSEPSWLYNFHPPARTTFSGLVVNGQVVESIDDLIGVRKLVV